jgi:hypothetical protein
MSLVIEPPKVVIFLGPTMSVDEAKTLLPDAIYRPPAGQGDLLSVTVNLRPQVIGLLDGVFLQSLSVWHKEILYAIEQGVHVFGASSMGALRAAELDVYGMRGIGEIYQRYTSGELMDDDEVALAHESAEFGFKKLSEPLINLRATFAAAVAQGLLSAAQHDQIVAIAKRIYFGDRVVPLILQQAVDAGLPATVAKALRGFCKDHYVDLKREDGRAMLQTIAALPTDLAPAEPVVKTVRSPGFDTMYNRDRTVPVAGREIPVAAISNYAAVHDADYVNTHFNALNRFATVALARLLEVEVSPAEVEDERRRLRVRLELEHDQAFDVWLLANHLSLDGFRVLATELALCRRMHRWFLYARWTQRSTSIYLDQLRLEGRYEDAAARAAGHERLVGLGEGCDGFEDWLHKTDALVADHEAWTDLRLDTDPATWAEDAGFHSKRDLKLELLRARVGRLTLLRAFSDQLLDGEQDDDTTQLGTDDAAE